MKLVKFHCTFFLGSLRQIKDVIRMVLLSEKKKQVYSRKTTRDVTVVGYKYIPER